MRLGDGCLGVRYTILLTFYMFENFHNKRLFERIGQIISLWSLKPFNDFSLRHRKKKPKLYDFLCGPAHLAFWTQHSEN